MSSGRNFMSTAELMFAMDGFEADSEKFRPARNESVRPLEKKKNGLVRSPRSFDLRIEAGKRQETAQATSPSQQSNSAPIDIAPPLKLRT